MTSRESPPRAAPVLKFRPAPRADLRLSCFSFPGGKGLGAPMACLRARRLRRPGDFVGVAAARGDLKLVSFRSAADPCHARSVLNFCSRRLGDFEGVTTARTFLPGTLARVPRSYHARHCRDRQSSMAAGGRPVTRLAPGGLPLGARVQPRRPPQGSQSFESKIRAIAIPNHTSTGLAPSGRPPLAGLAPSGWPPHAGLAPSGRPPL